MSQTFTMVTRFSATLTVAWDGQGHAWRLNGSPDGRNAAEHTFNCEACGKGMGYYGEPCPTCGADMPPVWIRDARLDHPINVQIKDELRKAAFKAFDEARDEMIEGTHTETYAVVGYPGDIVDSLVKVKEAFQELYKGAAEFDHPPRLFKPELFEMTPDVPPEYKLPDLRFAEYTEEEHATLLAEVQRRARERAYRPSCTPEEVEMLAKGSKWLEEYDKNNGVAVGVYFGKPKNIPMDDGQEFESLFQQVPDMMNAHMPMSEDTRLLKWLTWAGLGDAQAQELIESAEVSYQPTFRAKCHAIKEMGIETEEGVKVSECIAYAYENTFEEAL